MDGILQRIGEVESPTGLAVLAAFCAIEYLFPPFPGDFAVIAGAFLVAARGWSLAPVLASTTAGSLVGASAHLALGRWLSRRRWDPKGPRGQKLLAAIRATVERFDRHGAAYLALNRFLPGIRSVFFLAAGWSGMPVPKALGWGAVSALVWNLLLVGAAFLVGRRIDVLERILRGWSIAVWIAIAIAIAVWLVRHRRKT
jgi:membrane protein DedA with SNARE-associated domain